MPQAQHPLSPPTLSGNILSVDLFLNFPTRITRIVADLTLQRFLLDRIFSSPGGVSGGAVVYDIATTNDIYPDRNPQPVAPGSEFPLITSSRLAPGIALVEKWGGKTYITDEARDRNDGALFMNELRKIANSMVRQLNTIAIAKLTAIFGVYTSQTFAGHSWSAVVPAGSTPTAPASWPHADIAKALLQAETQELGVSYDTILLNPVDLTNLINLYGTMQNVLSVFDSLGLTAFWSNRVTSGQIFILASGQVGEYRLEKPLSTETWREQDTQRTWVQTDVRPVMFVNNPYAVVRVTGIA